MKRLTKKLSDGYFVPETSVEQCEDGYLGEAVEKLARFENAYEELERLQETILLEIEQLKICDRTHSIVFKEKLAMKVMNANALNVFKSEGI